MAVFRYAVYAGGQAYEYKLQVWAQDRAGGGQEIGG